MKKIITVLCCASLMLVAGCKKEEQPNNQGSGNSDPVVQHDEREGAYDPVCKIAGITYNDGTAPETWLWDTTTGHLMSVNDDDMCGGYVERVRFTYRPDGRVDQVDISNLSLGELLPGTQLSGTLHLDYSGDYISNLTVSNNGMQVLAAQVQHDDNSHKVSGATLDMSEDLLLDLFNMLLAQFLNDSTGSGNAATSVDNVTGSVAFQWEGNNVSQARLNVGFRVESTVGTLVNLVGEENLSTFGTYGTLLALAAAFAPNQPVYFTVSVGDTVDYTYDNKVNPFKNYLGRVHISCLSANNMDMEVHNGNIGVVISTSLSGQMTQIYQTSYPLPIESNSYEYLEYNASGCPLRIRDDGGVVTEIHYME